MSTPPPQLDVGPALMPDFMTGALLLSILAWPTHAEMAQFSRVSEELMADVLRQTRRVNPASVELLLAYWPKHNWAPILARARKRRIAPGTLKTRLRQRMVAAKIAIGLTHEELFRQPAKLPPSLTGLSIDQLATLVKREIYIDDTNNIEKLVWRKALPIIHLAIALQLLLTASGDDRPALGFDIQDRDFMRRVVLLARDLEPMVIAHPAINISADSLVRIRWHE
jgi:hypothetical protein